MTLTAHCSGKISFRAHRAVAVALCALLSLALVATEAPARAGLSPNPVAKAALPPEARATLDRIKTGGPFPYVRDGAVFGNREKILPMQPRGYYHEYTVPTPGASTRAARRIVCGGNPRTLAECYYSDDHYRTFRRIRP